MGAAVGEAVWMIGTGILSSFRRWKLTFPNESRGELLDRVHQEIEARQRKRMLTMKAADKLALHSDATDEDPDSEKNAKGKKKRARGSKKRKQGQEAKGGDTRSGLLGGAAGKEMWFRVITEPVMMEMLLSTKACMLAYTSLMGTTDVSVLLRPGSGMFAASFWLPVETLLKVGPLHHAIPC